MPKPIHAHCEVYNASFVIILFHVKTKLRKMTSNLIQDHHTVENRRELCSYLKRSENVQSISWCEQSNPTLNVKEKKKGIAFFLQTITAVSIGKGGKMIPGHQSQNRRTKIGYMDIICMKTTVSKQIYHSKIVPSNLH